MPTIPRVDFNRVVLNEPYFTGVRFKRYYSDRGRIFEVHVSIMASASVEYCYYEIMELFCEKLSEIKTGYCPMIMFHDHIQSHISDLTLKSTDFYL